MKTIQKSTMDRACGAALALIVAAAAYRVWSGTDLTALPNFAPVLAMAFCSGWVLPGLLAFVAPLGCIFISDLLLNVHYGQPLVDPSQFAAYACYLGAILVGRGLRGFGWGPIIGATVANSFLFYLVTNSLSWWQNPHYAQSAAGWVQALTVGRPGFAPTWIFFRNSLVSDLLFTVVFVAIISLVRRREASALRKSPVEG